MTCVEEMTCGPLNGTIFQPLEVFRFWYYQYGLPDAVALGVFLGILVAGIYLWTRSLNILVILGVYCITVTTTFAVTPAVAPAYQNIIWIIALGIASLVIIMLLKVLRE